MDRHLHLPEVDACHLTPPPPPPTASHLQPSTFQDMDQEEDDGVGYIYSDSHLDSSPTLLEGAILTAWLVLYLLPGSSSAGPDCCRSLMCLPDC